MSVVKLEPDVLEGAYDCAVCWKSCRSLLKTQKRVMTCVRCPAVSKVCEACYESLPDRSCIQCSGPLSEYQSHHCEAPSDGVIDVDAISAAAQDACMEVCSRDIMSPEPMVGDKRGAPRPKEKMEEKMRRLLDKGAEDFEESEGMREKKSG